MLTGGCTGLRAIEKEDLPALLNWRNQYDLRRYFREYRELSMEHQLQWYQSLQSDHRILMFSILDLSNGNLIGAAGIYNIDWKNRSAELTIYIGIDGLYIDEKYASDAAKTITDYAFDELGMHRVWAEIYDFDTKKQSMLEKLGFILEGRHRDTCWFEHAWHDSLFYSLIVK